MDPQIDLKILKIGTNAIQKACRALPERRRTARRNLIDFSIDFGCLLGAPGGRLSRLFESFFGAFGRSCVRHGSREGSEGLRGAFQLHF